MPRAILALRSYPLAILMALVIFVCSFLIATSSIGTIGGGGDDQGSGMGGTGRTGGINGDSGLGGTGAPSPFLGSDETEDSSDRGDISADSLIMPFLQQQDIETARIPEDMRPLIELQRNAPRSPEFLDSTPALDILDEDTQTLPPHARRLLDMADADNATIVEPTLEIRVQIPEGTGTDNIERFRMELAAPAESALPAAEPEPGTDTGVDHGNADRPLVLEQLQSEEIADTATDSDIDEARQEDDFDSGRPLIPERIQRPELPPFQRMRPAVDRASIVPPRPRPMQI
ncbi:hypothetical protein [Pseudohongiella sp.]|uniref:Uncharacterized protein n=1 Tax=marine sediment metagenome TaxID=412755 RepID=A0A0F9WHG9_9ZZZZ|nr:hypothetical protein [Pseudohongiella sp.]HDZ08545.1 hypothetical protein [Pseudohongiella sp.]HEA61717.1 hypothetical protein [Pseudohongiella sp.]